MHELADQKMMSYCRFILISLFLFGIVTSCDQSTTPRGVTIVWKDGKAVALAVPTSLLKDHSAKSLKVQMMNDQSSADILGQIRNNGDTIFFDPLVPFTRGLHYKIVADTTIVGQIEVPLSNSEAPQLLSFYPTSDTVPENLLKVYLRFSQPMEEGHSLSHITVLHNKDTLKGTFLDLQPELWNNEGTILTLWLDPGRIKRDLIPNKELGAPLKSGENYILVIDGNWRSKAGKPTREGIEKRLVVISRDERSPVSDQWQLTLPSAATTEPLVIDFNESLDFSLANESIFVVDNNSNPIKGIIELSNEETQWKFSPEKGWIKGNYFIKIESRLEDMAGNNLNRVFDRDITKRTQNVEKEFFEKPFVIR